MFLCMSLFSVATSFCCGPYPILSCAVTAPPFYHSSIKSCPQLCLIAREVLTSSRPNGFHLSSCSDLLPLTTVKLPFWPPSLYGSPSWSVFFAFQMTSWLILMSI
jgi:hypothetical protein